jgi:hypothetical protein
MKRAANVFPIDYSSLKGPEPTTPPIGQPYAFEWSYGQMKYYVWMEKSGRRMSPGNRTQRESPSRCRNTKWILGNITSFWFLSIALFIAACLYVFWPPKDVTAEEAQVLATEEFHKTIEFDYRLLKLA